MSNTERVRMVEVLHRELGRMVDRGYLADALIAAGFGDVTALRQSLATMDHFADVAEKVERRNNELVAERDALAESSGRNLRDVLNEAIRLKRERSRYKAERDALAAKVAAVEAQPIVAYGVHPPDGCVYVPWVDPKDDYRTAGEKTHAQKSVDRNQGRGGVWSVVPLIERAGQEPLTPDVLTAIVEAYQPKGIAIWIRSWLGADPSKRLRMEAEVLAEWSGIAAI